jgi:phosphoenolpyruvate-protein kinase (PTS system EI component)
VVIDGSASDVIVDPTRRSWRARAPSRRPPARRGRPSGGGRRTADGVRSGSTRTSSFPTTWRAARYAGAEDIGLYRSEFLLTQGADDPGEEDRQYEIYRGMLEGMARARSRWDLRRGRGPAASRLAHHPLAGGWAPEEERGSRQGLRGCASA